VKLIMRGGKTIEYLSRLYEVQSSDDRTSYEFIPVDSEVEKDTAEKLDSNEALTFFP